MNWSDLAGVRRVRSKQRAVGGPLRAKVGDDCSLWSRFLYGDASLSKASYKADLSHFAPGPGHVAMRSSGKHRNTPRLSRTSARSPTACSPTRAESYPEGQPRARRSTRWLPIKPPAPVTVALQGVCALPL